MAKYSNSLWTTMIILKQKGEVVLCIAITVQTLLIPLLNSYIENVKSRKIINSHNS